MLYHSQVLCLLQNLYLKGVTIVWIIFNIYFDHSKDQSTKLYENVVEMKYANRIKDKQIFEINHLT